MEKLIDKIKEEKENLERLMEEFEKESDANVLNSIHRRILLQGRYIKGLEDALVFVKYYQ